MDASTITSSSFTLKRPDGSTVAASVGYDSATGTATLTPTSVLAASTTYTARLETTIRAVDGTALATPVIWSFTTAAPAAPPTVTAESACDSATRASRVTTVDATFFHADVDYLIYCHGCQLHAHRSRAARCSRWSPTTR